MAKYQKDKRSLHLKSKYIMMRELYKNKLTFQKFDSAVSQAIFFILKCNFGIYKGANLIGMYSSVNSRGFSNLSGKLLFISDTVSSPQYSFLSTFQKVLPF